MRISRNVFRSLGRRGPLLIAGALFLLGCGGPDAPPACTPPAGTTGSPATIGEVVDMANAMLAERQQTIDLPCFVQALQRPLAVLPVLSPFSLQPGDGPANPRVFLWTGETNSLAMSVAFQGQGRDRLELAEYTTPTRSIKAEIGFPVETTIARSEPYERILSHRTDISTICGGCHADEQPAPQVTDGPAFESVVFQPLRKEEVQVPYLEDQMRACNSSVEPDRCRLLRALFGEGAVDVRHFAPDARTIYGGVGNN